MRGIRIQIMPETLKTGQSIDRSNREATGWSLVGLFILGHVLHRLQIEATTEELMVIAGAVGSIAVWASTKFTSGRIARIAGKIADRIEDRIDGVPGNEPLPAAGSGAVLTQTITLPPDPAVIEAELTELQQRIRKILAGSGRFPSGPSGPSGPSAV